MPERAAGVPHRVEALVVDLHERAGGEVLAQEEAEGLQDLEAARAGVLRLLDGVGLDLRDSAGP